MDVDGSGESDADTVVVGVVDSEDDGDALLVSLRVSEALADELTPAQGHKHT